MFLVYGGQENKEPVIICHAFRKRDGQRCTRLARKGDKYCWQHSSTFQRRLVILIAKSGGLLVLLVACTDLILNSIWLNETVFPASTPTSLPHASKLYFTFIVDASNRMSDPFDGDLTKWDSVREAALNNLILGLPARANYGLILLGGNSTGNVTNCDTVNMVLPFGEENRDQLGLLIEDQEPQGVSSLAKALDVARDNLLALSDDSRVEALELWVFLGGGDLCSNNDLRPILYFVNNSARFLTKTHMDLFILSEEITDWDVLNEIEKSSQAGENVEVSVTTNSTELAVAVNQSYEEAKERVRQVEPAAVAAQETIVAQTPVPISALSITATVGVKINTPTPQPTSTPSPVVILESVTYLTTGESCSVRINFQVRESSAMGNFHVWNSSYGPEGDIYPTTTFPTGPNIYEVILRGHTDPIYYRHKIWFIYNGVSSNFLDDLVCPGLTPWP